MDVVTLRKLGFWSGIWWAALKERDEWLEKWIQGSRVRFQLFAYRTTSFVAVAGILGLTLGVGNWFWIAAAFGALVLWTRSESWVTEYRDVFAGRYD